MGRRSTEIGNELMGLLDQQTEFLSKTAPTPEELSEYERRHERTSRMRKNSIRSEHSTTKLSCFHSTT
jgi:hypothetical protein